MNFQAALHPVGNRGAAPQLFLETIVRRTLIAPEEIFARNENPRDIYAAVMADLGPFGSAVQRRAVMLEVMRVHAGLESSWNWREGVDVTNARSQAHMEGQETGIFQVSFDSVFLGHSALLPFVEARGIETPEKFIPAMKLYPALALEYYARLVRVSIAWAGPLKRGAVNDWLRRDAVAEFVALLGV